MISAADLEPLFHRLIPLTRAMGVRVAAFDPEALVLTAPLEANHNHLGTAFGGSQAALLILAGYGLLWLELGDSSAHIVIREQSIRYRRPVVGELRAAAFRPDRAAVAEFQKTFAREGKARLELHAAMLQDGQEAARFRGTFVALRGETPPGS